MPLGPEVISDEYRGDLMSCTLCNRRFPYLVQVSHINWGVVDRQFPRMLIGPFRDVVPSVICCRTFGVVVGVTKIFQRENRRKRTIIRGKRTHTSRSKSNRPVSLSRLHIRLYTGVFTATATCIAVYELTDLHGQIVAAEVAGRQTKYTDT